MLIETRQDCLEKVACETKLELEREDNTMVGVLI